MTFKYVYICSLFLNWISEANKVLKAVFFLCIYVLVYVLAAVTKWGRFIVNTILRQTMTKQEYNKRVRV